MRPLFEIHPDEEAPQDRYCYACLGCGEPVDTSDDIWDERKEGWWHEGCWEEQSKEVQP